jgi:hypothetical protein
VKKHSKVQPKIKAKSRTTSAVLGSTGRPSPKVSEQAGYETFADFYENVAREPSRSA